MVCRCRRAEFRALARDRLPFAGVIACGMVVEHDRLWWRDLGMHAPANAHCAAVESILLGGAQGD